ncbi:MAG: translocation/assembly module TamB domain-containing protein [Pseudomonadota bacterium]
MNESNVEEKKIIHSFTTMTGFKKMLAWFFGTSVLLLMVVCILVATQKGSRWAVEQVAKMADVRVTNIKGNLLTGLDIASIDFDKDQLQIHAEKIVFRWQPLALFYTAVSVQSFSAENIQVHLPPAKPDVEDKLNWPSLALPVRIELGGLKLRAIKIQQDNKQLLLDNVTGSLSLGTFHLRATDFTVANPQFRIAATGTMGLRYPYSLDVKSQWHFKPDVTQDVAISGDAIIGGDVKKILLSNNLTQPILLKTIGTIDPALQDKKHKPHLEINNEWPHQPIPAALLKTLNEQDKFIFLKELLTTQGQLKVKGWLDSYTLQGSAQATTIDAQLSADINAKGTYTAAAPDKNMQLKWHIENFRVTSQLLADKDNIQEKSYLHLTGDISWSPSIEWNLIVRGEHINTGQLFPEWPSNLKINVASQGEFKNQQDFSAANWRLIINQLNIEGELRGLKLDTQGTVDFDGKQWKTSNINIALGANKISLKGKAGKNLALEWNINAPLLNQIDPRINGSIISSGYFNGAMTDISDIAAMTSINSIQIPDNKIERNKTQPKMQMKAEINQFSWKEYSAQKLVLNLNSTRSHHYQFALDAAYLQLFGQRFSNINVKGDGSIAKHNINGLVQSPTYGALEFNLDSGWKNKLWQGKWRNISIALKKIPRWYLSSSSAMEADASHVELGRLCLTTGTNVAVETKSILNQNSLPHSDANNNASKLTGQPAHESNVITQESPQICMISKWDKTSGLLGSINAVAVPLRQAQTWVKPEVTLAGVVDAQLLLQAAPNQPIAAEMHMQTRSAQLIYQFQGGNTEVYSLKQGKFDVALKNNQMDSLFLMDWGKYGIINAANKYTLKDKKIQGTVSASLPDLAPLESLLPTLNDVHGSANAAVTIAGTIDSPQVTGNITIANGSATMPTLGLELKEISLQIVSQQANLIQLNAELLSGDGRLKLKGSLNNVGAEDWHAQGNIFGDSITIIKQTQLSATISPNLTFTANKQAINLNGSTEIPWARTAIKALPESATRVSKDVVILDSPHYAAQTKKAKYIIPFYTNVILYFGDDVRFKGFGLDGQLSGKINVLKEENRQTFTTGFVAVNNGIYKAYGQELTIARGRLIFQGPYDNPGLDIRAIRTIQPATSAGQAIVAGLEIGGTLQRPKSTVFSIPSEDDSKAMALLVTGKSLDELSPGDAYAIVSAMSSLGVENESSITSDIAKFFRLDEITIKADKGLDQSALWMGKYITPRLFVRYVVGLFDQAFTLGMRYQITNKLRVEVESGKTQSVDVIYKIER